MRESWRQSPSKAPALQQLYRHVDGVKNWEATMGHRHRCHGAIAERKLFGRPSAHQDRTDVLLILWDFASEGACETGQN